MRCTPSSWTDAVSRSQRRQRGTDRPHTGQDANGHHQCYGSESRYEFSKLYNYIYNFICNYDLIWKDAETRIHCRQLLFVGEVLQVLKYVFYAWSPFFQFVPWLRSSLCSTLLKPRGPKKEQSLLTHRFPVDNWEECSWERRRPWSAERGARRDRGG